MTKEEIVAKLVEIYTDPQIPVTAAGGIFAFTYGEHVVDVYRPTELMTAANALDQRVKKRYEAELGSALNMYRYFKAHPEKFAGRSGPDKNVCTGANCYQIITYGAPGTGKSFSTDRETKGRETFRTTFHPDSDYSTFVGSYKPTKAIDPVRDGGQGRDAEWWQYHPARPTCPQERDFIRLCAAGVYPCVCRRMEEIRGETRGGRGVGGR